MSDERFDLMFRGDLEPGHTLPDVKLRLAKLFKANEATITQLFSGRPVALKKNLEKAAGEKYVEVLIAAGAHVVLQAAGSAGSKAPVKPKTEQAIKPPVEAAVVKEPAPAKKMTMAERLQAQEEQDKLAVQEKAAAAKVATETAMASGVIGLAPAGTEVLSDDEREIARPEPVQVHDLLADLAPAGSEILSANEKAPEIVANVDTSSLSVAAQEGNLVASAELLHLPDVHVDVPDFSVAPPGETLDQEDKPAPPPAPDIQLDIAPVGAVLDQEKKTAPPAAPDTSNITLV